MVARRSYRRQRKVGIGRGLYIAGDERDEDRSPPPLFEVTTTTTATSQTVARHRRSFNGPIVVAVTDDFLTP
nr:hypothetical protein Itr_chr05CG06720 [Ipomoea trifida]